MTIAISPRTFLCCNLHLRDPSRTSRLFLAHRSRVCMDVKDNLYTKYPTCICIFSHYTNTVVEESRWSCVCSSPDHTNSSIWSGNALYMYIQLHPPPPGLANTSSWPCIAWLWGVGSCPSPHTLSWTGALSTSAADERCSLACLHGTGFSVAEI